MISRSAECHFFCSDSKAYFFKCFCSEKFYDIQTWQLKLLSFSQRFGFCFSEHVIVKHRFVSSCLFLSDASHTLSTSWLAARWDCCLLGPVGSLDSGEQIWLHIISLQSINEVTSPASEMLRTRNVLALGLP